MELRLWVGAVQISNQTREGEGGMQAGSNTIEGFLSREERDRRAYDRVRRLGWSVGRAARAAGIKRRRMYAILARIDAETRSKVAS